MARLSPLRQIIRTFSPTLRKRGVVLKRFSESIGLVYFGRVNQHDDDHSAIRGFTTSLSHQDSHYSVGTYNGYNIRLVDRFDVLRPHNNAQHEQLWAIIEVELESLPVPHLFFVPTGREAGEYSRLYATQPHMHPLNTMSFAHHSPEFHGRFQILSSATYAHKAATLFTSPIIVGIASRFWPHGIEIEHNKLLVYITQHRLTKTVLEATLASALWLAETIEASEEV